MTQLLSDLRPGLQDWRQLRLRKFVDSRRGQRGNRCLAGSSSQQGDLAEMITRSQSQQLSLPVVFPPLDREDAGADQEQGLQDFSGLEQCFTAVVSFPMQFCRQ